MKHYRLRTERAYVDWIRRFILFHDKRHPDEMGEEEIARFPSHLAVNRHVAASTRIRPSAPCSSCFNRYWIENSISLRADWLVANRDALSGKVSRIPTRDEMQPMVNEQLIVELYSR